jgi:CRISPR-associated endonuclease Csn1
MCAKYRLGIDLGVNSLGWCALRLDDKGEPEGLLDIGVRLFSDGRDPK